MRSLLPRGLAALLLSLVLIQASPAQDPKPASRRNPVTEAVAKTKASIVSINVPAPDGGKDMIGSGVIIDQRGIIVTNRHVVGANSKVTVRLHDGTTLAGEVLVADAANDLAVVRINAKTKLSHLRLAPASDLMQGEDVIAIGHPFGYTNSVSTGIVSFLGREIEMPTRDVITGLIQHTAAINPGNSGGALLNINGELIGINVALRDGAQNIAFAINADNVKAFLSKHLNALKVAGVNHGLTFEEKIVAETGDRQRVVVAADAAVSGLKQGDEIRTVGGLNIGNSFDVERALWGRKAGDNLSLKLVRQGQELTVTLTVVGGQGAGQVADLRPMPVQTAAAVSEPR